MDEPGLERSLGSLLWVFGVSEEAIKQVGMAQMVIGWSNENVMIISLHVQYLQSKSKSETVEAIVVAIME